MILIADNLTVTHFRVAQALERRDPRPVEVLASTASEAGAAYLDVNLGRRPSPRTLDFVLDVLSGCWDGGLLIDCPEPEPMERAAARWKRPLVLNGFSGDPGRERILDVAVRHGLELVVLCMAGGVPLDVDERLALAVELVGRCQERGLGLDRLWVDPLVLPLGWENGQVYSAGFFQVLRRLPEVFGEPVATLAGVSNLTTGTAGRRIRWLEGTFVAAAAGAGLSHVLADVENPHVVQAVRALDAFENRRLYAPEEFAELPGFSS